MLVEPLAWLGARDWLLHDETGVLRWHGVTSYVRARRLSGEPHAGDGEAEAGWFARGELASLPMHPVTRELAQKLLRGSPGR
jgi:hypothetical protein